MNPAFIVLFVIGAILLWFLLAGAYVPIGRLFSGIYKNAKENLEREEGEKGKNE